VLEQDLGDYPFSTTGGVATSLDSGFALENQTRPTYSPGSLNTETVVHELAHQWFGDRVAVEHWRDIWLNEGPATYYEWRYDELRGGRSVQDHFEEWYDYGWNASFWSTPIADPGADNIFGWPVYYRGGMTLAALRNRIGDPDFEELMLSWVTGRDNGSTADFTALAETVSGQDLTGFFDAWLGSGKPADTADNGLG
jgi:aminopeptidase N